MATFVSHYEKALRRSATGNAVDGRLQGSAPVVISNVANAADTRTASAPFELFGPGDVQRLASGAITRRFPAPGTSDAEETKLALVEFVAPDLPWRYTPAAPAGDTLRPWLVLVVGRRSPDEIVLRPDGRVTLGTATQANHALTDSWKWAHVHEVDGRVIARVVSPLNLAPGAEYVACVVPAFTPTGTEGWTGAGAVTCDCYDRWTFRTGPEGDFPDLAAKLRKADLAAIEAAAGKPFGRADLTYVPRTGGAPPVVLSAAGALRLPPDPSGGPDPADEPPDPAVAAEVAALTERILTSDGRGVVTAPRYDAPFVEVEVSETFADGGWIDGLRSDPRVRGAAGLGAWTAIEWQDRISDAAATKAGDLAIAEDRIRHVAFGVEVSRSLWRRRLPPMPSDPNADPAATTAASIERLAVLAPVLGRLPTGPGTTALDAMTGRTPQLGPALLSSAARRAMRPGPARTARAQEGAGRFGSALSAANACPEEVRDPADIVIDRDPDPDTVVRSVRQLIYDAAGGDDDLAERILEHIGERPSPAVLIAALQALRPGPDGRPDPEAVEQFLQSGEFPDPDLVLQSWPDWMAEVVPPEQCRPIDMGGFANAVTRAVDPTVDPPPAASRVLATLPGITHIGPVEIEPDLDLPLWSFLSSYSPDWMLPGAGDLAEHDVVGLSTNPGFIQALLTGANFQTTGELRWRNIPMLSRWTPLRKFWQRAGGEVDIAPVKGWPDSEPLGSVALTAGRGAEAVVAFRTPLFRRYPATVVYLYPADADWQAPPESTPLAGPPARKDPTFTGSIGDDITFFGFPVAPADLSTHWVVLEEPPAGYRFYYEDDVPPPSPGLPDTTSANFAYNRFALPVRVLIGPLL